MISTLYKMRKFVFLLSFLGTIAVNSYAQQDPMFTKYAFNALNYNPAYAGSAKVLSLTALYRNQWVGFQGAPTTGTFSIHSPLRNDKIALGGTLFYDKIGRSKSVGAFGCYAYRIPTQGGKASLSLGLQGGVVNYRANFNEVASEFELYDNDDAVFANAKPNLWLPNFGAGIYYQAPKWFLGVSAPQLIKNDLRKEFVNGQVGTVSAQQYRHYFVSGGMVFKLSRNVDFRPMALWKNVGLFVEKNQDAAKVSAPNEVDLDLSFLFNKTLWVGAAYRTAIESKSSYDSVDFWFNYLFKNTGLRFGAAYDYTLTDLRSQAPGSFEIMVGYDFNYKTSKIVGPRYF